MNDQNLSVDELQDYRKEHPAKTYNTKKRQAAGEVPEKPAAKPAKKARAPRKVGKKTPKYGAFPKIEDIDSRCMSSKTSAIGLAYCFHFTTVEAMNDVVNKTGFVQENVPWVIGKEAPEGYEALPVTLMVKR
jgi:hypothetical protein